MTAAIQTPTPAARPQSHPGFRADIEGLRAIAVLMVVGFHAHFSGFAGGFVGVDIFFVLSGYLITRLLVGEAERNGRVELLRFYARRARRLLPALTVMLAVTFATALILYAPYEQRRLVRTWATTALYASNLDFARQALDYYGWAAEKNPLLHTWSLSVEEQFYLVWPWLVLGGLGLLRFVPKWRRPGRGQLIRALSATTVLSFALSLYLTHSAAAWAFYLSPTRAWEFGAGGLASLVVVDEPYIVGRSRALTGVSAGAWGWAGLLGLGVASLAYDAHTTFPGVAALLPVACTVLLLRAGGTPAAVPNRLAHVLSAAPLQAIGRLSYSWYLWHWPLLVFGAELLHPFTPGERLATIALSLAFAYLSFRYVEDPLRRSRLLTARPRSTFALAAAATAGTVLLAVAWRQASTVWSAEAAQQPFTSAVDDAPQLQADGCNQFGHAELTPCIYGDTAGARTVVLIGDSHAAQLFPAVERAVDSLGGTRLEVLTLASCPIVDLPPLFNTTLRRFYPECVRWRTEALEEIRRVDPAVVVVASFSGYDVPPEQWESGTRSILHSLHRNHGRTVLVLDPLRAGLDVPACLARVAWRPGRLLDPDCHPRGDEHANARVAAQEHAARAADRVGILDLRRVTCGTERCDRLRDGPVPYRDGNHLTSTFAATLSGTFAAAVAPRSPAAEYRDNTTTPPTAGHYVELPERRETPSRSGH